MTYFLIFNPNYNLFKPNHTMDSGCRSEAFYATLTPYQQFPYMYMYSKVYYIIKLYCTGALFSFTITHWWKWAPKALAPQEKSVELVINLWSLWLVSNPLQLSRGLFNAVLSSHYHQFLLALNVLKWDWTPSCSWWISLVPCLAALLSSVCVSGCMGGQL